jgi:hypothetical protein
LTGCVYAGTLAALLAYFLIGVRGRFRGPVPQAATEADLARLEQELEG